MVEILSDTFIDVIKTVPVLFLVMLLSDWIAGRVKKGTPVFNRLTRLDTVGGAILGIIPQCGISVAFAKLYANGYITLGMLTAVFLAASDEALIVISAYPAKWSVIAAAVAVKVIVGITSGTLINIFVREKRNRLAGCGIDCDCPKCQHTHDNLLVNSLIQTLKLTVFIYATVFLISLGMDHFGTAGFVALLGRNTAIQPVISALIGLIPSCISSVLIAEGYLKGALTFGSMIAGLCANTGFGIIVVCLELPVRKSIAIILLLLAVSILIGEAFHLGFALSL